MKSPFNFIVKPVDGSRYNNTKKIGGINLITNTSSEDHKSANRFAEVIETPLNYGGPIVPGDLLLVHHNVFKFYNDMQGQKRSGRSFFKDNVFFIDDEQYFLYKHAGEWHAKEGFCFVKPIPRKDHYLSTAGKFQPLMGEMIYDSQSSRDLGIRIGDVVSFLPNTEYEFKVDGQIVYRMYVDHIVMVVE